MEYSYLVASLPRLDLGSPPPLSSSELLRMSDGVLQGEHWHDLRMIVESRLGEVRTPEARRCADIEIQLRDTLGRARAQRAGTHYEGHELDHVGYDSRVPAVAGQAMATDSPIERELILDRHRWALLDEIAALPAFGVQAVFAYGFKLRLAEKWAAMDEEAGHDVAVEVVERNLAGRLG